MASCIDTLPPGSVLCNSDHCDSFQKTADFRRICDCIDWQGNKVPNCTPKDDLYPVQSGQCYNPDTKVVDLNVSPQDCMDRGKPWYWQECYCCCVDSSTAQVAVPEGTREMGDVVVGDQVLSASRQGAGWVWHPHTVQHSAAAPARSSRSEGLFYLAYGVSHWLIAAADQLFLTTSGKLKRADRLVPGQDAFVSDRGQAVPLVQVRGASSCAGVHQLATEVVSYEDFSGSIDNHLLNINGIIGGDYLLQLFQNTPKMQPNLADAAVR